MLIKGIECENFGNYHKPSMFIAFPKCSFKCDKECGMQVCQNSALATAPLIEINIKDLLIEYKHNDITEAIVCGGLEPFDSWDDLFALIQEARYVTLDDIVIYTGYTEKEIKDKVDVLKQIPNIIIKFGRFLPDTPSRYDPVLDITLASDNQYAKRIS